MYAKNVRVSKKETPGDQGLREVSRSFIPIITEGPSFQGPSFPYFRGQGLDSDLPQVLSRWKVVTFLEGADLQISPRVGGMDGFIGGWMKLNVTVVVRFYRVWI